MDRANLTFNVPAPPQEWLKAYDAAEDGARVIVLWETTVFLIVNEAILGQDQKRYLAMIDDQRVSSWCHCPRRRN